MTQLYVHCIVRKIILLVHLKYEILYFFAKSKPSLFILVTILCFFPYKKKCYMGLRSRSPLSLIAGGRYAHAYGNCTPLYCISLKKYIWGGGITLPRGLISRDIAVMPSFKVFILIKQGRT